MTLFTEIKKPSLLWRVADLQTKKSLWYDPDGNYNPIFDKLTEGQARNLPMEFDPVFKDLGLAWLSATDKDSDLKLWFSPKDILELQGLGYGLYEFKVNKYRIVHTVVDHAIFTKEDIIDLRPIAVDTIYSKEELYK